MRPSARFSETTISSTTIAFITERSPDSLIADHSCVAFAVVRSTGSSDAKAIAALVRGIRVTLDFGRSETKY